MVYQDRADAGRILAEWVLYLRGHDPVVVGVAAGGVAVAREIAVKLDAPLDALVVRKLDVPGYQDLTMGAVGEGAVIVSNHDVLRECRISPHQLADAAHHEHGVVARQMAMLRRAMPPVDLTGRNVVLVDDGISTGATIRVAIRVLRAKGARRVILAVPVAPAPVLEQVNRMVDQVICPKAMRWVRNLRSWYVDFPDVDGNDIAAMLREHTSLVTAPADTDRALPAQF
ncbi:phosphoribosyltransferase [Haloechinothrix salitolerans]|uniref:Phosphoribosyltransferase n=1 Tax=Haloechinothrix salitolerans TaxID=926830 RepID=A0ABW2C2J0_9PSEU